MRVVILQPGYIPWLGFFDQLAKSDTFVIYDDVQYDKNGWRNRNRIKTPQGSLWLTVPVLTKGKNSPSNREVMIDNKHMWQKKHISSIYQSYYKSPYFKDYFYRLESILLKDYEKLLDLNMDIIYLLADCLGIETKILFSSELGVEGEKGERVLDICKHLNAEEYLTGDSAKNYLDEGKFSENSIKLIYHNYLHPVYNQMHGEFIPYLSVMDLLFNHGRESLSILKDSAGICA
ncbi:MAG: WbqC family protein [Armatimonadota bacterium]